MIRIGSSKNAAFIAEHANGVDETDTSAPDDWSYLGSGWSRNAYLGPDNVVYKVGLNYVNRQERHNVRVLRNISHPIIRIPLCTSWTIKTKSVRSGEDVQIVNAMEYIKGKPANRVNDDVFELFGIEDNFFNNFAKTPEGKIYIIDLGETRKRIINGKAVSVG